MGDGIEMNENKVIRFELLGSFSWGKGENDKWERNTASGKKAMSFLQYLIVNHTRNISAEELIDRFWSQRSTDPVNALRSMLFKIRRYLKEMFPGLENMIVTLRGCYAWDPALRIELDSEEFERACIKARRQPEDTGAETLSRVISLYKGDFLAGNDSDWAIPMRQYYQTLYLDACREALPLLQKQNRWMEVVSVCEQAQNVDFAAEDFVAYRMQALLSLGQSAQAVEQYEQFRDQLWDEFQITPSEHVEQIYALAMGMSWGIQGNEDILKLVAEEEYDGRAFFCNFRIFQQIVALERRHLARSGGASTLVLARLTNKVVPATDAKRLERVLLDGLRAGDPVARLDATSYILMLTGSSPDHAQLVTDRLERAFRKTYSHSKACISFRISELEPGNKVSVENL